MEQNMTLSAASSVEARIEILEMVDSPVDVGLRIAVWGARGGKLLNKFNSIQRRLAKRLNISSYDFDKDVLDKL